MGSKKSNKKAEAADGDGKDAQISGKQRRADSERLITDSRFAAVQWDPRFQKLPKHKTKVSIDSRFDRMFSDKNFASSKARIDKRGKPKKDSSFEHPLKRFYRRSHEEEEEKKDQGEKTKKEIEKVESVDEREESESDGENLKKQSQVSSDSDLNSGSDSESESKEEDEEEEEEEEDEVRSGSGSTTDSEDEEEVYSEEEETFMPEENIPEIEKETHRLAVVNMDWGQVKAADLYVLLSSFLPKGGQILSVAVYPSEFGLRRMEEEAVHGPVSLFEDDKGSKDQYDDGDDEDEIDHEKLRAYELSRLRYYYAAVECDSSATADYLYKTCDGVEFERSSNKLDLRFIPDSIEFKHPPRDVATESPENYEGIDFQTRALQQSKIQLTWDEDEPQRAKTLKRKFNADQLAELELKELLASDESESDEDDEDAIERSAKKQKTQEMYKALIQSGGGSDGDGDSDDDGQDMEVTFNTGLEDISKRILEKKGKESETVWEAYLRKKKEKKKARKNKSKDSSGDEGSDTDREPGNQLDDFFVEEPLSNGSKKAKRDGPRKGKLGQELTNDDEASRAELELILTDDKGEDTKLKGYNLKRKKAKGKRGKEMLDEGKLPTVDYDDPRFSDLFTSPQFALDPTDPQFKRSAAYARQVAQKQHKGDRDTMVAKVDPNVPRPSQLSESLDREKDEHARPDGLRTKKEKHELSSLVKSIKMKSKQVSLPPIDKVSAKSRKLVVMKPKK